MKKLSILILGICAIVAVSALCYVVFVKPEPAPPVPPPPPPVNGDTSKIDTSDWKTYRNEEFEFEIRYPEDWKVIVGEPEPRWHETVLGRVVISGSAEDPFYAPLSITIRSNEEKLSVKEWFQKSYPKNDISKLQIQKVKFNKIDGMKFSKKLDSVGSFYFPNKDKIYSVSPLDSQENLQNQRMMTEKLLSTFKFIE